MAFNIKRVAIIGGGPSGLAALYEFLHTSKEGKSHFGGTEPNDKLFDKVVVFEQRSSPGGVWSKPNDKEFPPTSFEEIVTKEDYFRANELQNPAPELGVNLTGSSVHKKITAAEHEGRFSWKETPLYNDLYTNIPKRFTRFSSSGYDPVGDGRAIDPFLMSSELTDHITKFVENNSLDKYIRYNTEVFNARKVGDKWLLVLKFQNSKENQFYEEEFDGLVVANGHYNVPHVPYIEGLRELATQFPGSVIHSKALRDHSKFNHKNVILVGSSVSGIDLTQYLKPIAKEFYLSRRVKEEKLPWINEVVQSKTFSTKPPIKKIVPEKRRVEFEDNSVVENIDHIVLATGYHYHYPFFEKGFLSLSIPENRTVPTNASRVQHLYYNIFKIEDPSVAFVGVIQTTQLFTAFEAQSAAIAGIWSNKKKLPSKEDQYRWEQERLKHTGDTTLFHLYSNEHIRTLYLDKIVDYFPHNRRYPLDENYFEHYDDLSKGEKALRDNFFKFIKGNIILKDGNYVEA